MREGSHKYYIIIELKYKLYITALLVAFKQRLSSCIAMYFYTCIDSGN